MSYILEALKKSQHERELGKVPTLDTTGMFEEDKVVPSRSRWSLLALGLAAVAMIVALYAALRGPAPAPVATSEALAIAVPLDPTSSADSARGMGAGDAGATAGVPEVGATPAALGSREPELAAASREEGSVTLPPALETLPSGPVSAVPRASGPLIEPPPPKQAGRIRLPDPSERLSYPEDSHGDDSKPSGGPDPDEEMELQRQMEADYVETWDEAEDPAEPAPTPVPRDLIADIEAFKREVRVGGQGPDKGAQKAPATALSRSIEKDPLGLRLTPAQEAELPGYLMTAHVYDSDQSRRFVLINGLKYREGEKTREGMTVERILAQGAVLSHKGNAFFVPR
jgi:general secretion pathway protein B